LVYYQAPLDSALKYEILPKDDPITENTPSPATLVLIEDNAGDVYLLRHALDQHRREYYLKVLRDGEEAMAFCEQCGRDDEPKPCVMVLDLHLPKYDGLSVLREIRGSPALVHVKVVAWTTVGSPAEEREVRELGVRLYRAKPLELDEWFTLAGEILDICHEHLDPGHLRHA
jgi:CheY-like chemotaxis protein